MASSSLQVDDHEPSDAGEIWRWVGRITFGLMLAVVLCRCTMLEFLRDPFPVSPGSAATARGPGPGTTLLLDLLCAAPAILVLLRAALDRAFVLRKSIANVIMLLLAIWIAAGTQWADDRFAATVDAANLCSALSMLWAAQQLARTWRHVRIVAAIAFGVLLICASHGVVDRLVELPVRQENFQKHLPDMLKQMNIEPGSFEANRIVQKIGSGELLGFSASINTFAAVMVICGITAAGAVVQRVKDRSEPAAAVATIVLLAACVVVLKWTDSRTAFVTPVIAAGLFGAYGLLGGWMHAHRRLVLLAVLVAIAGVIAFLIHHGLVTGTLFHDSLNFRWRYWVGGWGVWKESPWIGVGLDGFGLHYLAHRLPIASEEVKDPHNFIVRAFTELGLVGGLLTLAWVTRAVWEMTKPAAADHTTAPGQRAAPPRMPGMTDLTKLSLVCIAGMLLAMIAVTDFALIDWNSAIELLKRLLYLCVCVIGGALIALRSMEHQQIDSRPAPWIRAGMVIAILIFLVHNLIDFSMFESSAMFIAALLIGTAWGSGIASDRPTTRSLLWARLIGAAVVWLGVLGAVAVPVLTAEAEAADGKEFLRQSQYLQAGRSFTAALDVWPGNADYAYNAALALAHAPQANPAEIRSLLDRAIIANPMSPRSFRVRAEFELQLKPPDVKSLRADFDRALQIDPNSVDMRLTYADVLADLGDKAEAKKQYETALWYNDQFSPKEPKRLSEKRLAEIRAKIARLA